MNALTLEFKDEGGMVTITLDAAMTEADFADQRAIAFQDLAEAKARFTEAAKLTLVGDPRAPDVTHEALQELEQVRRWLGFLDRLRVALKDGLHT